MEIISFGEFEKLRLQDFFEKHDIQNLERWEFMGDLWIGDAVGFTEWLRLEKEPTKTRSISVDLRKHDNDILNRIFSTLKLPLKKGQKIEDLAAIFGQPVGFDKFVADRINYDFEIGKIEKFTISCTILNEGGLIYFVMMRK
jgi:hypothetical protein